MQQDPQHPALLSASTIIGDRVANDRNEDLGKVHELMIDVRRGTIAYVVVAFGGLMGVGSKLFAVPWKALQLDPLGRQFRLDIERGRLESAPGFDKDNWPNMNDLQWGQEVHRFYGATPYWE